MLTHLVGGQIPLLLLGVYQTLGLLQLDVAAVLAQVAHMVGILEGDGVLLLLRLPKPAKCEG